MTSTFKDYIALGLLKDLELLADHFNCVLWIRDATYAKQLYVSMNYNVLFESSTLTLYKDSQSWNQLIDVPNSQQFSDELKKNRLLLNPNYTATYCILTKNGTRRWFLDRSFQLNSIIEANKIIAGCALPCNDKRMLESRQNEISDTLDLILAKFSQILTTVHSGYEQPVATHHELLNNFTKREKQIFRLFIQGCTIAQVAVELNLSARTIESHLNNLKVKLDCSSKSELIMKAIENQWLLIMI